MSADPKLQSLNGLTTEAVNPASANIDTLSPLEIVQLMNSEDATVSQAVAREAESIAKAIEVITRRIRSGGRLVYIGAGTSGRLGVLDASECPPTFSTPPEMVVGLIAGGDSALRTPAEGVEDHPEVGADDVRQIGLCDSDVLVGIATSGRTPYVIGALEYARSVGAYAIGFACNEFSALASAADLMITPIVGPEIISGSTRMKAGTATKMVLNMLTTGTMVQLGKTYGNLMVDLRASNQKLMARTRRLVAHIAGVNEEQAERELNRCCGELKTAVVAIRHSLSPEQARDILNKHNQQLRLALQSSDGDGE
ncbi:MAG: N-acetylmuramic acid 6-phosphate etherase [Planctomycetaceae bacterium]